MQYDKLDIELVINKHLFYLLDKSKLILLFL